MNHNVEIRIRLYTLGGIDPSAAAKTAAVEIAGMIQSMHYFEWMQFETKACDCIASGNMNKPKQHGADPHAKNCAIYIGRV